MKGRATMWDESNEPLAIVASLFLVACSAASSATPPPPDAAQHDASIGGDAGYDAPRPRESCSLACGNAQICCLEGEECTAAGCMARCAGVRCGSVCCEGTDRCLDGACTALGDRCDDLTPCADGFICDFVAGQCRAPIANACRSNEAPALELELVWSWRTASVEVLPLVVSLTDDNGDGAVDERDVSDIVVSSFALSPGVYPDLDATETAGSVIGGRIVALDGSTGVPLWESSPAHGACAYSTPAAADIDGDGSMEIITQLAESGECIAFGSRASPNNMLLAALDARTGELKWMSSPRDPSPAGGAQFRTNGAALSTVSVADLNGDEVPELLAGIGTFSSLGELLWIGENRDQSVTGGQYVSFAVPPSGGRAFTDGRTAWDAEGNVMWTAPAPLDAAGHRQQAAAGAFVSGAGLDQVLLVGGRHDDRPETGTPRWAIIDGPTGEVIEAPTPVPVVEGQDVSAPWVGPITSADVDGDGLAEAFFVTGIGATYFGARRIVALSPAREAAVLWTAAVDETLVGGGIAQYGLTLFDFEGDGTLELIYSAPCALQVLDALTGAPRTTIPNRDGAIFSYPIAADIDGDESAELIVAGSSSRTGCGVGSPAAGVRVYRAARGRFAATRRVWTQHAYVPAHVHESGRLASRETIARVAARADRSVLGLRINPTRAESVGHSAYLEVSAVDVASSGCEHWTLSATVRNDGARASDPRAIVVFEDSAGQALARVPVSVRVPPGGATAVTAAIRGDGIDPPRPLTWTARIERGEDPIDPACVPPPAVGLVTSECSGGNQ